MKQWLSIALLGGVLLSVSGFRPLPQISTTTLELSIQSIKVEGGVAEFGGPASNIKVEIFNQVDDQMVASVTTDSKGMADVTLDESVALSAYGEFHLVVKNDDSELGAVVCIPGSSCELDGYQVDGLSDSKDDGVLITRLLRSPALVDPVPGIKVIARVADATGYPGYRINAYTQEKIYDDPGINCVSDENGLCVFYISPSYRWEYRSTKGLSGYVALEVANELGVDVAGIEVKESSVTIQPVAVNDKGRLDDCTYKTAPENTITTHGCSEKRKQTATAQAQVTPDKSTMAAMNEAIAYASMLSKNTADLFTSIQPDEKEISAFLKEPDSRSFDPLTQVKLILYVNDITNDGYDAQIGGKSIGAPVKIYKKDDPGQLLGACIVNLLGECVTLINQTMIDGFDGTYAFRALVAGFDNGILVCKKGPTCEQHVYNPIQLTGNKDAVILYRVVREDDYTVPVKNISITAGMATWGTKPTGDGWGGFTLVKYSRGCISDEYGACPIYVSETGFTWSNEGGVDAVSLGANLNGLNGNDINYPLPTDDQLEVYWVAVNRSGSMVDCSFTNPLDYPIESKTCKAKQKVLQTAVAGYTATPTVTITPIPSATPTATEVPPTPTITPTLLPTKGPGFLSGGMGTAGMIGGVLVLLILAGGGAWLILRKKRRTG